MSLSYSKKYDCHKNSNNTINCYLLKGKTYNEAIVLIKEFKTKQGLKTFKFINTYKFSVTSSKHYWEIVEFYENRKHETVYLNFNGSMNYLENCELFDIDNFKKCEFSPDLEKFISENFSKKISQEFLDNKKKDYEKNIVENKKYNAKKRLLNNILNLNYSSEKNLKRAIENYGLESLLSSYLTFRAGRDTVLRFYNLLESLKLENHLENSTKNWVIENKRLNIFNELDNNNLNNLTEEK